MSTLLSNLRSEIKKRNHYRNTVKALQTLPSDTAEDIGVFPADAERIAANAVYGAR